MSRETIRLFAAAALAAVWLVLPMFGHTFGGAIHLAAVAAIALAVRRPAGEARSAPEGS
jgi:hypothetical protein